MSNNDNQTGLPNKPTETAGATTAVKAQSGSKWVWFLEIGYRGEEGSTAIAMIGAELGKPLEEGSAYAGLVPFKDFVEAYKERDRQILDMIEEWGFGDFEYWTSRVRVCAFELMDGSGRPDGACIRRV